MFPFWYVAPRKIWQPCFQVVGLVRIVIHTIAAHSHVCDRFVKPMIGLSVR
jgi:hypothetical protein